ncbi:hypothetical protein CC86DRAFT_345399 [Ophiobolus disseminans]|uniref:SnoaL-like domain-containing protein n=1 Tax=Ophiobolus disseminans TaxID=1469910 RepID=A0A6A7A8D7_9PLEO|nr:hypothetical protein CC86DRAFT_345399 [Ophiobolus disseminans]
MLSPVEARIQKIYHSYRHTSKVDQKGLFFSPTCVQICRPIPDYAATTRGQIVQYLKDAQEGNVPVDSATAPPSETFIPPKDSGVYTIRPLHPTEATDFSLSTITSSIHLTPLQLLQKSRDEGWIGMRVDLWDEGAATNDSLLVKVQYWWRKEEIQVGEEMEGDENGEGWRQCLHDIMYLGPKDGTEGEEGLEVRE